MTGSRDWDFTALTPIWTGDAERKNDRLITTGLLGSIRWWFEVVVRGLGGSACDPSDGGNRCPDQNGKRCVVCELFGCTGWARKFRFQVLDTNGGILPSAIKENSKFRFRFVPLRPIAADEWALLDLTLRLIAKYGAVGGRTVWKPTDETARASAQQHQDYGVIGLAKDAPSTFIDRSTLQRYVEPDRWRKVSENNFAWASLKYFWCVDGRYLARQDNTKSDFNRVLGRKQDKSEKQRKGKRIIRWSDFLEDPNKISVWLAGKQQESKKVFSFKDPARTFGFVKPGTIDFDGMKGRLRGAWHDLKDEEVLTGSVIIDHLFNESAQVGE